jgi:antitoxin VapB
MDLSVKNPRAHELASQIAELTGDTLTSVVIQALQEKLESETRRRSRVGMAKRIREFAERFAEGMPPDANSGEHGSMLYGEDGLPR